MYMDSGLVSGELQHDVRWGKYRQHTCETSKWAAFVWPRMYCKKLRSCLSQIDRFSWRIFTMCMHESVALVPPQWRRTWFSACTMMPMLLDTCEYIWAQLGWCAWPLACWAMPQLDTCVWTRVSFTSCTLQWSWQFLPAVTQSWQS